MLITGFTQAFSAGNNFSFDGDHIDQVPKLS